MEAQFSPDAARILDELEKNPANDRIVDAIWDTIDLIREQPDSAQARRRALRTAMGHSIWLVPVPIMHDEDRWVILWQPREDDALIAYIGPEDFGAPDRSGL
jgi:ParE toxin of type II toxin-antitoxin system, parDE